MNKVITLLTLSDIFNWGLSNILSALIGLYLAAKLDGDTIKMIGIGTGIYLIFRSLIQIIVGKLTDKIKKDKDEIIFLSIGNLLMGIPYMILPFITSYTVYFVAQAIFGLGSGINLTSWRKLFSQNIKKGTEGNTYAIYDVIMSLATAIFSYIAGIVGNLNMYYFNIVVYTIGITMVASSIIPLLILNIKNRNQK